MSGKTNFYLDDRDALLLNVANWTGRATPFLSLHTADPTVTGSLANQVPNSNAYARTAFVFGAPTNGVMSNSGTINFPTATGSWGTVSHLGIHNSGTHGAAGMDMFGAWDTPKAITTDDRVQVDIGDLTVTET